MRVSRVLLLVLVLLLGVVATGTHYDDRCCTEVFDRCYGCLFIGFGHIDIGNNDVWGCVEDENVQMDCDEIDDPAEGAEPCWVCPAGGTTIYQKPDCTVAIGNLTSGDLYVFECYDGPTCD